MKAFSAAVLKQASWQQGCPRLLLKDVVASLQCGGNKHLSKFNNQVAMDQEKVRLHQIGKGQHTPSFSPPCLKLETYLRMAKIPYEIAPGLKMSSKGKIPWIELGNHTVADSNFCIDFLNQRYGVDLNKHLTAEEKAVGHAFQRMIEENSYWCGLTYRWKYADLAETNFQFRKIPGVLSWIVKKAVIRRLTSATYGQGMGRHNLEEINSIMLKDVRAFSTFLGPKDYMFGAEPCQFDPPVFAMMCQLVWQYSDWEVVQTIQDEMPNIGAYCRRMRTKFYPDWDSKCVEPLP